MTEYYRNGWKFVVLLLVVASIVLVSAAVSENASVDRSSDSLDTEGKFLKTLNEERRERGLEALEQRDNLTAMAQSHAKNMATHEYVGHKQPDGTRISDRFGERGLLPECEIQTDTDSGYYAGVENAFAVENPTTSIDQEIFNAWMESEGHRKAMLLSEADEAGLGVAQNGDTYYVALEIC